MIEISKLTKTYEKSSKALKSISLTIDDGEFVFITGRSGSGKSTLMKILLKEVEPTSGRVVVNDMDLGRMPRRYVPKYRRTLGVVFQDFRLLKDRTVYENVAFAQRVIGAPSRTIRESVPRMLKLVGLSSKYKSYPHQLSGGEQQMLAMGRALMSRPKLLMLDEPSMGLAPILVEQIFKIIQTLHEAGTTILLVEQNAQAALSIADRGYVLETGKIVTSGTGTELLASPEIKKAYLGG